MLNSNEISLAVAGTDEKVACIVCSEMFTPGVRVRYCRFQKCVKAGLRRRGIRRNILKSVTEATTVVKCTKCHHKLSLDSFVIPILTQQAEQQQFQFYANSLTPPPTPTEENKLQSHHKAIVEYALQYQQRLKPGVIRKCSLTFEPGQPEEVVHFGFFKKGDERLFGQLTLSYLAKLQEALGSCEWLAKLAAGDLEVLSNNHEPGAMLLALIATTMPALNEKLLVLPDGVHEIAKTDVKENLDLLRIFDRLQIELVPRFRELNIDDSEMAIFRMLTLWNPNLYDLSVTAKPIVSSNHQLLLDCLWMHSRQSGFLDSDTRYATLLDLLRLLQDSTAEMQAYIQGLRNATNEVTIYEDSGFDFSLLHLL